MSAAVGRVDAERLCEIARARLSAASELHALSARALEALEAVDAAARGERAAGEAEALLASLLDARERCVARLGADEAEWRALAGAVRCEVAGDAPQAPGLAEARALCRETAALLASIAEDDAAFLASLATRRASAGASLAQAAGAQAAHRAYAPSLEAAGPGSPRFMDRRC